MTRVLAFVFVVLVCGLAVWLAPRWLPPDQQTRIVDDFVQYWAAGRLNLRGQNPYDPELMHAAQRTVQPQRDRATLMWNPPWTLAVAMPLGMLPYLPARVLWMFLQLAVLMGCIAALWQFYGRSAVDPLVLVALTATFPPVLNVLGEGQISGLVLLGLVGFLWLHRAGCPYLGGACATLTLVKPHLMLLFWWVVAIQALTRRQYAVLAGAGTTLALMTLAALAFNPDVLQQYQAAVLHAPPFEWVPPTVGATLRLLVGWDRTYLTFVAPALGLCWATYFYVVNRDRWQWERQLPLVVLVSVVTAAYGWVFDQVVLLIPVIVATQAALRRGGSTLRVAAAAYGLLCVFGLYVMVYQTSFVAAPAAAADLAALRGLVLRHPNSFWFVVIGPAVLVAYLWLDRHRPLTSGPVPTPLLKNV